MQEKQVGTITVVEIETRVTTAIAALEEAGYLKRGQNMPRIFANSILSKNAQEAIDKINASQSLRKSKKKKESELSRNFFQVKAESNQNDELPNQESIISVIIWEL